MTFENYARDWLDRQTFSKSIRIQEFKGGDNCETGHRGNQFEDYLASKIMKDTAKEPAVLKAVQKIAILEKNGTNLALTMKGLAYPEDKVIIFDLGEAVETIVKPRGRRSRPSDDKL